MYFLKGVIIIKKYTGEIGLILVAIIWGSGFVATEIGLDNGLTPLQLMTIRFFIGAVLINTMFFKKMKSISKSDIKAGSIIGFFLFLAFELQTFGLQYTTSSKSAFITAANVVIVPFIGYLIYKKKLDKIGIISSIVALLGIGVISLDSNFSIGLGDSLTFLCAIAFAMHIFCTGEFTKKHDPIILTGIQMAVAFILSLSVQLIVGQGNVSINKTAMISLIYLGVFNTSLCFLIQTICQAKVDENKTAILLSTEAIFGMLFSVIVAKEVITFKMIIGSMLIFAGIIMAETKLSFIFGKNKIKNMSEINAIGIEKSK